MDTGKLKEQVDVIREAFSYINRFKGRTFVIKIDGAQIEHELLPLVIKDIILLHRMGIKIVLVPGARPRIDEVLKTYRIRCKTVNGIRISTPKSIPFIKMAAFDVSNTIMTMLAENKTTAIIGNWVKARAIGVRDGTDFKCSGMVEDLQVDKIKKALDDDVIPVFPNIGWNTTGQPYNVSSNELASALSRELQAAKLFFVTNINGISAFNRSIPDGVYVSSSNVISQLTVDEANIFLDTNDTGAYDPQLELVSLACSACESGVPRTHIVNGAIEGMILKEIFSSRGYGTMVYANQHANIRPLAHADIPEVLKIMQPLIDEEILIPRSALDLELHLSEFAVYEVDGTIHACGGLHLFPERQAEIAGIAVDDAYANLGIGKKMIAYFIDKAKTARLKQVFVLTTRAPDFFEQLGFKEADKSALPSSKQRLYKKERNSKIYIYPLRGRQAKKHISVE
ncbi:MAG: amino-acid N-acetyltransferase [Chitinivibrionales bacterium]|nr:amino-acid N-acetyltransferase [Chitinivibrionales bacterium]